MKIVRLEELPNIGNRIAADLKAIGIETATALQGRAPMEVFHALREVMGARHDPCVLYTLLSVEHFFRTTEKRPWWEFTEKGKLELKSNK